MATIEQAEALVVKKEYAAAEALCQQLKKAGVRDIRLDYLCGSIAYLQNDYDTAMEVFLRLRKQYPDHPGVLNNLGNLLVTTGGDLDEAQSLMERSLELAPGNAPAMVALGELYLLRKKGNEANKIYDRLVKTSPNNPQGYFGMGVCASLVADSVQAEEWFEKAHKRSPNHPQIISNLLQVAARNKNYEKAIRLALQIVETPELEKSLSVAWAVLKRYCLWEKADALLPRVIESLLAHDSEPQHISAIALDLVGCEKIDHATLKRLHVCAGEGFTRKNLRFGKPDTQKAFQPAQRMRIGYLSGDFRNHVVSLFAQGIVNHHDTSSFEIFLYSSAPVNYRDETSGKYFRVAEHFVDCHSMDDGELAKRIAADGIHVLVDLSGFTMHSRASTLTLSPAPVQMTYIGYPATYGMKEVDYIISHKRITGSDHASAFVEAAIELPNLFAINYPSPNVQRPALLPCTTRGFITFGSLINSYKINRGTVTLWSKVLKAVPGSRIYLNHPVYKCKTTQMALKEAFVEEGIVADRVTVTDERPEGGGPHFLLYDNIDIVLDATPMTGGATTADAISLGIPVVSRLGTVFHERLSASAICGNVPDPDIMLAESDESFVEKAVALANNPGLLARLRHEIRHNVLFGPNRDAEKFTQDLENLYRRGWNQKFPGIPIDSLCSWQMPTEEVVLPGYRLRLPSTRNDLQRYVALETGIWFEPECAFVARHAAVFSEIWDISDDSGLATFPVACRLQVGQTLTCLRLTHKSRTLLAENCALNPFGEYCHVVGSAESLSGTPLLIRFAAERNDGCARLLREIMARCESPPLMLLVSTDGVSGPDHSAADHLSGIGYVAYRLHTGCGFLVPYAKEEEIPSCDPPRNLFFVIPEAQPLLEEYGLLCQSPVSLESLPSSAELVWQKVAYSPGRTLPAELGWHDVYLSALNAYALAREESLPTAQRLAHFNFAHVLCRQLTDTEPTPSRVLTTIRLTYESGLTEKALTLAKVFADQLQGQHGKVLFEPCVLPHPSLDGMRPEEDEALWVLSLVLVAIERMRSWSSFFTAAESILLWRELEIFPWWKDEAERMLGVLRQVWEVSSQQKLAD